MRKTNTAGLQLIKHFEGFSHYIYLCPAGFPTIGYGHLCKEGDFYLKRAKVTLEDVKQVLQYNSTDSEVILNKIQITAIEAESLLTKDLEEAETAVTKLISTPLTDNQFAALVSFTFNLGAGALQKSTLRRKLNRDEYKNAAREFQRWVYADGRKLSGLVKRRGAEKELFLLY